MGKKAGNRKKKFVPCDFNNMPSQSAGKVTNKSTKGSKGNDDSTSSIEKYPTTPTSNTLESSADISTTSTDTTKGDESTDSSTKLSGQDNSNCSESEISINNSKPEKVVKNGIQNVSVSSQSDDSFQKNDSQFENSNSSIERRNDAKGSNKAKQKGKGAQSYDSPKLHSDANATGPGRKIQHAVPCSSDQQAWGDSRFVKRYETQFEKGKNANTREYRNSVSKRNETSYQEKDVNSRKSSYDNSAKFWGRLNLNPAPKSHNDNYVKQDNNKNIEDSWEIAEVVAENVQNYSNQSLVERTPKSQEVVYSDNDKNKDESWETTDWDDKSLQNYSNQSLPETQNNSGDFWSEKKKMQGNSKQSTMDDFFKGNAQKSKTGQNWRNDRNSLPAMSSNSQNTTNRSSEGNRSYNSNRGSSKEWQNRNSSNSFSDDADTEHKMFRDEEKKKKIVKFVRVEEIEQDLFAMPKDYSLGHCVAEDMRMGSGIAVMFKREFKQIDCLLDQKPKQGGLAVLEDKTDEGVRYLYYLVTKRESTGKPTYDKFWSSLQKMRNHIKENGVNKLAIPRLGCGLDRLDWDKVKHMIEFLFRDVDVKITVCNFQQNHGQTKKKLQRTSDPDKPKKSSSKRKKK